MRILLADRTDSRIEELAAVCDAIVAAPGVGIYGRARAKPLARSGSTRRSEMCRLARELARRSGRADSFEWLTLDDPMPLAGESEIDYDVFQILIKSFRRFDCLKRCVESIQRHYPAARVLVADDSLRPGEELPEEGQWVRRQPNVTWFQLPFDVGLAAGRNYLVRHATAPILVNCDDDFVFTSETRLERFLEVLEALPEVSIVTGLMRQGPGRVLNFAGRFRWAPGRDGRWRLRVAPIEEPPRETPGGARYVPTDLGLNFFAARRDALLKAAWDETFKVSWEHLDHFLQLNRHGLRVVYCPDVVVDHRPVKRPEYIAFRARRQEYASYFFSKWNLDGPPHHQLHDEKWWPAGTRTARQANRRRKPAGRMGIDRQANTQDCPVGSPPNIVVLGIGHSGTSVLAAMLGRLGWDLGPADHYAELPAIRQVNDRLIHAPRDPFPEAEVLELLSHLKAPWAIKDPRFVHTIDRWIPVLKPYQPCLLWITRDLAEVEKSYRRRGEGGPGPQVVSRGKTLQELWDLCVSAWHAWPWGRLRISYEQLSAAVALFRSDRRPGAEGYLVESAKAA